MQTPYSPSLDISFYTTFYGEMPYLMIDVFAILLNWLFHSFWVKSAASITTLHQQNFSLVFGGCSSLDFAGFFPGYRLRAGSGSPGRRRDADRRYSSDFDNSVAPPRGRDFSNGRDRGRFRDSSPPYARGRGGGRPLGRGFDGPGFGPGPLRGEGVSRNNPNVRPREGDWICSDPL